MLIRNKAFTLIELIIVVAILLILSTIGLVQYSNVTEKARSAEAYAVLADITTSENSYYAENNNVYTVDFTKLDRYDSAPLSQNFIFSIVGTNDGAYALATKQGSAQNSYAMCLKSAKKCSDASCSAGCP